MNRLLTSAALVLACCLGGQVSAGPCDDINFDTVIFRDDFTGTDCSPPDPSRWVIGHPEDYPHCWWVQGRTFFPTPVCLPDAPCEHFPHLQDNVCVIRHYDFNPYHLGTPKETFLGGELHTIIPFEPTRPYRFEARVCWPKDSSGEVPPRGLVTSFFTYGYDEPNKDSDEIDLEFLSNEVFVPPRQVLTNTWDDSHPDDEQVVMPDSFDLTEWQTFRIYWYPDPCIKWTWIDPGTGEEVVLRTETDSAYIPDETMYLYFNFWAPTADWPKAYDADLQPDQEDNGVYYEYWIDHVEVRVPEPASCVLLAVGAAWILGRRRRTLRQPY